MNGKPNPPSMESVSFITGYWSVASNPKRNLDFYRSKFPETVELIGHEATIALWENPSVRDLFNAPPTKFKQVASRDLYVTRNELIPDRVLAAISTNIKRSAKRLFTARIKNAEKEKHYAHLRKHLQKSNHAIYLELVASWMTKLYAINFAVDSLNLKTSHLIGWADTGVSRIWNSQLGAPLSDSIFHGYPPEKISHLPGGMFYRGKRLGLSCGLMVASPSMWSWALEAFEEQALKSLEERYLHDEETILEEVRRQYPQNFQALPDLDRSV
jgi:hypothetical protein